MSLDDLATRIQEMISAYYYPAPSEPQGIDYFSFRETGYWEPPGEMLSDILVEELGTSETIALLLCDALTEREDGDRHVASGGELFYSPGQHYVTGVLLPDIARYETFRAFERRLRYEARLFHPESRAVLASIFDSVDHLVTVKGAPVVVVVPPGAPLARLHRGRVFQSDEGLRRALIDPDRELGSPPAEVARAGRMNAANVSVFYGATTAQTALAEVRAPAHARVLRGEFELLRPIRLLDVDALTSVRVHGSKFDPAHQLLGRHALLLQIVSWRISQPVLPDHQDGSYLVTQAIADYLAYECSPPFDGMMYPSTQTVDGGVNIVLFHPSARCAVQDPAPGVYLDAELESQTEDGPEPEYTVWTIANDPRAASKPAMEGSAAPSDKRPFSLRLLRDTLTVHHIKPAEVKAEAFEVGAHSHDASVPTDF